MNRTVRSVLGVSSGVVLAGVSACAMPSGDTDSEQPSETAQQSQALESFDPCTFFQQGDLKRWGMQPGQSEDGTEVPWEPTCTWHGPDTDISLSKNVEETVDSYGQSGNWESYEKQQVAGRSAAVAQIPGAEGKGCNILVDAGGGVVIYQITVGTENAPEPCGELRKLAEPTASRLPE